MNATQAMRDRQPPHSRIFMLVKTRSSIHGDLRRVGSMPSLALRMSALTEDELLYVVGKSRRRMWNEYRCKGSNNNK